jgi:hypothetical protein
MKDGFKKEAATIKEKRGNSNKKQQGVKGMRWELPVNGFTFANPGFYG